MNQNTPEHRFWMQLGHIDQNEPSALCLNIQSFSEVDLTPLFKLLRGQGIKISAPEAAAIWLLIVDTLNDPRLSSVNTQALAQGRKLLIMKPVGVEIEYAAFDQHSACWSCFEKRNQLLDGPAAYLKTTRPFPHPVTEPQSFTSASTSLAFSWIAAELDKIMHMPVPANSSSILNTLDIESMQTTSHVITKLSYCTSCGDQKANINSWPQTPDISIHQKMV